MWFKVSARRFGRLYYFSIKLTYNSTIWDR